MLCVKGDSKGMALLDKKTLGSFRNSRGESLIMSRHIVPIRDARRSSVSYSSKYQ